METLKKLRLSIWKNFVKNYFAPSSTSYHDFGDFTFPPSNEFLSDLRKSFSESTIRKFENGPTFSAYQVSYDAGGRHGTAIYKTTTATYPLFNGFDTLEEYKSSFSIDD
jgi:hypothetical protein